jgi:transcriptional regulator with XRE-family HTH domain
MGKAKPRRRKPKPLRFPLREILSQLAMTQYRCAQVTGLSQQLVSNLCTGRKAPSWRMLMHIMTSLGADVGDLAPKGVAS